MRFNPFFIRASVYCGRHPGRRYRCRRSFNPFFIRASVYWTPTGNNRARWQAVVSIPSSSGHQFTVNEALEAQLGFQRRFNPFFIRASVYCVPIDEAHVLDAFGFNPFFIRASVYCAASGSHWSLPPTSFQSLLHQGISLLPTLTLTTVW